MKPVKHDMIMVRAEVRTVPTADHGEILTQWIRDVVEHQGMEIMKGPIVGWLDVPGLVGWSGAVLINTSHCAFHVFNDADPKVLEFDFYTCGYLDFDKIIKDLQVFEPTKIEYKVFDREHNLRLLDEGYWRPSVNLFDKA